MSKRLRLIPQLLVLTLTHPPSESRHVRALTADDVRSMDKRSPHHPARIVT